MGWAELMAIHLAPLATSSCDIIWSDSPFEMMNRGSAMDGIECRSYSSPVNGTTSRHQARFVYKGGRKIKALCISHSCAAKTRKELSLAAISARAQYPADPLRSKPLRQNGVPVATLPSARSPRAAASPITIRKHTEYTHSIACKQPGAGAPPTRRPPKYR